MSDFFVERILDRGFLQDTRFQAVRPLGKDAAPEKKREQINAAAAIAKEIVGSMTEQQANRMADGVRLRAFEVMQATPGHIYQILTKRPANVHAFLTRNPSFQWPPNAWLGVSLESAEYLDRVDLLRSVPADIPVRFLSIEPLVGAVMPGLHERVGRSGEYNRVSWIIVGGES